MRKYIIIAAFGLILGSGYTLASDDFLAGQASSQQWIPMDQVVRQLLADGYQVREIEVDDGLYEASAIAPDGRRVEIEIDPISGRFIKVEEDD